MTARYTAFVIAIFAVAAVAKPIRAFNLVQDPGFESAMATPDDYVNAPNYLSDAVWQVTMGTCIVDNEGFAHGGNNYALVGPFDFGAIITQTLPTQATQSYDLSFYYTSTFYPLVVDFGANPVSYTTTPGSGYNEGFANDLVATGASTSLSFYASGGGELLDDISVTIVPEPVSVGLLGAASIGVLSRRRRLV